MTKEGLVTAPAARRSTRPSASSAQHRIEKLPVVDDDGRLRGLITVKDIHKRRQYPDANKDQHGRLRVAAAIGAGGDFLDARARADRRRRRRARHRHRARPQRRRAARRRRRCARRSPTCSSSPATSPRARARAALVERGVDAVKVGVGPGLHLHDARRHRRRRAAAHRGVRRGGGRGRRAGDRRRRHQVLRRHREGARRRRVAA